MDVDAAEEFLNKILDIYHANSHIRRAALLAIETSALHPAASINTDMVLNWRCRDFHATYGHIHVRDGFGIVSS
jgi:hypothetical protein